MPLEDVKTVNMPKWDELSVKHMWPKMKAIEGFMLYMPDRLPKKILPDREYFFNIMNSVNPDYVQKAIQNPKTPKPQESICVECVVELGLIM